jgi:hypothetical protein
MRNIKYGMYNMDDFNFLAYLFEGNDSLESIAEQVNLKLHKGKKLETNQSIATLAISIIPYLDYFKEYRKTHPIE